MTCSENNNSEGDPSDDLRISDTDEIWRRIPPWHLYFDENLGNKRPSSAAFEDHPNGSPMSGQLLSVLRSLNISPEQAISNYPGYGLVSISVKLLRSCGQKIYFKDVEGQPGHVEVSGNKTKKVKREFAKECKWLILPTQL